jgi:hypothetical protein
MVADPIFYPVIPPIGGTITLQKGGKPTGGERVILPAQSIKKVAIAKYLVIAVPLSRPAATAWRGKELVLGIQIRTIPLGGAGLVLCTGNSEGAILYELVAQRI